MGDSITARSSRKGNSGPLGNGTDDLPLVDGDAGLDSDGEEKVEAKPRLRTKQDTGTSFLNLFRSAKEIERNQKHAEIMAALKTSKEVEKQLIQINEKLDKLIAVLTIATEGGTKSLLLAAANDAKIALSNYSNLIANLNSNNTATALTEVQIKSFRQHWGIVDTKCKALHTLRQKTSNISVDVKLKVDEVEAELKKALSIHEKLVKKHPEVVVPKSPDQRNSRPNVDGSGINRDSDSGSEDG